MKTAPDFWWRERQSVGATLLRPLGAIYGAVAAHRMIRSGTALPAPVICVGNLVAGGAGKTPTAIALATMLMAAGRRPAFLSRGYGRAQPRAKQQSVLHVDAARQDAAEAGDEPLLLATVAPTYVSVNRVAAGRRALADGADLLVLDDGLQSPSLQKTASVAVVDGTSGTGNGLCIPAGPLRAPLSAQWPRVSAVCLVGEGSAGERVAAQAARQSLPVWRARLAPDAAAAAALRGKPFYAFAGIGRPSKFFATLEACGADVRGRRAFPDHHRYSVEDRKSLLDAATASGAALITTAKDRVRLPVEFPADVLDVSLRFDDRSTVEEWLRWAISQDNSIR